MASARRDVRLRTNALQLAEVLQPPSHSVDQGRSTSDGDDNGRQRDSGVTHAQQGQGHTFVPTVTTDRSEGPRPIHDPIVSEGQIGNIPFDCPSLRGSPDRHRTTATMGRGGEATVHPALGTKPVQVVQEQVQGVCKADRADVAGGHGQLPSLRRAGLQGGDMEIGHTLE